MSRLVKKAYSIDNCKQFLDKAKELFNYRAVLLDIDSAEKAINDMIEAIRNNNTKDFEIAIEEYANAILTAEAELHDAVNWIEMYGF